MLAPWALPAQQTCPPAYAPVRGARGALGDPGSNTRPSKRHPVFPRPHVGRDGRAKRRVLAYEHATPLVAPPPPSLPPQVVWETVRSSPHTAAVPLLCSLLCMGLGLMAVFLAAERYHAEQKVGLARGLLQG